MKLHRHGCRGFSLLELLTVIALIIVLAGLLLFVGRLVQYSGAEKQAKAEIATLATVLEEYKADNGAYPDDGSYSNAGTYVPGACASLYPNLAGNPASYNAANLVLYRALSGDRNCDGVVNAEDEQYGIDGNLLATPLAAIPKVYYAFGHRQLLITGTGVNSVKSLSDPFGDSYGYSTAFAMTGMNGYNPTYDLWSTAGNVVMGTPGASDTAKWITNW